MKTRYPIHAMLTIYLWILSNTSESAEANKLGRTFRFVRCSGLCLK